jgi:myosin heavy subunit
MAEQKKQLLIVTGMSGAGKTVAIKFCGRQFATRIIGKFLGIN